MRANRDNDDKYETARARLESDYFLRQLARSCVRLTELNGGICVGEDCTLLLLWTRVNKNFGTYATREGNSVSSIPEEELKSKETMNNFFDMKSVMPGSVLMVS